MKNSWFITNAIVITPSRQIDKAYVLVEDGKIMQYGIMQDAPKVDAPLMDAKGSILAPGLIDAHTHGAAGYDYLECTASQLKEMLAWLAGAGVSGVLPTLGSAPMEKQLAAIEVIKSVYKENPSGTGILGIHLEGSFLNKHKRGSQVESDLRTPAMEEIRKLVRAGDGLIRLVTIAPELPGAKEVIQYLVGEGITVSCGHTEISYEDYVKASRLGIKRITHTYNCMPSLHHRDPGVVAGAFLDPDVTCELVLDGNHVHPAAAKILVNIKGTDKVTLVTDSTQATGLPDGEYIRPGNRHVFVSNGTARLENGTIAGSVLTLKQAVQNAVGMLGLPLADAIKMASTTAAASLALPQKGHIAPGMDADMVMMDGAFNVNATWVQGNLVYQA